MSKSPWRAILIGGLGLVLLFAVGVGWIVYKTGTEGTGPLAPSTEQLNQLPAGSQSATTPSGTTATVETQTPENQTAELETIGQALDEYKSELQKYPDSLAALKTENPNLHIPSSFNYGSDVPLDDLYSLCVLTDNSQLYECISSEFGSDDPFTFPSASVEAYNFSSWQALTWKSAVSSESDVTIAYPPDWTYSTSTFTGDLTAQDAQGNAVIIGRFNLFDWQMRPSETFSEFEKEHVAETTAHIASTTQLTVEGFPAYTLSGTDTEGNQTYDFGEALIQQNTYVFQLDFFIDQTISDYFSPAIKYIVSSIKITPKTGE